MPERWAPTLCQWKTWPGEASLPVAGIDRISSMSTQTDKHPPADKRPPDYQLNPGDDAAPGTPGTGEDICQVCHGSGKTVMGGLCPNCGGTGKIVEGIGGG
jgi:hypothetical protein